MALVVTPGSPVADAFITVAYYKAWAAGRGLAVPADQLIEEAIRRATTFISTGFSFAGYRTFRRLQSLAWPRYDVWDREGDYVASDAIPTEIEQATALVTQVEIGNPGAMAPAVDLSRQVKSKGIGTLRKEYFAPGGSLSAYRPAMLAVNDLLSGLMEMGTGNALVGEAVRR